MSQQFLTLEGVSDAQLGGWFKKATTPPKVIRRIARPAKFLRPLATKVSNLGRKTLRYGGAAVVSPFVPASVTRKAFALSARESKQFETSAKVVRGVGMAVGAVVTGMAVAPMLGPSASGAMATAAKYGAALVKTGGVLYGVMMNPATGQLIAAVLSRKGAPESEGMPEGVAQPIDPDVLSAHMPTPPPAPAGSGTLPDAQPVDYGALYQKDLEDKRFLTLTDDEFQEFKTPLMDAFDTMSLKAIVAQAPARPAASKLSNEDGSYSLRGLLQHARLASRQQAKCPRLSSMPRIGRLTNHRPASRGLVAAFDRVSLKGIVGGGAGATPVYAPASAPAYTRPAGGSIFEPLIRARWESPEERFMQEYQARYMPAAVEAQS